MAGPGWTEQATNYANQAKNAAETAIDEAKRRAEQAAKDSFAWTQAMIDVITAKAADGEKSAKITATEKAFLYTLYQGIGAAGAAKGMPEASLLIRTYVRVIPVLWGEPSAVDIGSYIYENSPGVKKEMARQLEIARKHFAGNPGAAEFAQRSGKMLAEQKNKRMFYADNRFVLESVSHSAGETTFRVENRYDFEPFTGGSNWRNHSKWSRFPFKDWELKIYDGLSQYLTVIGLAAEFDYYAEWKRRWK